MGQIHGLVGHLGFTVALLFDADCLNVVRGYIGVVLTHPELEEGLESVLKAGLGGVMAADAAGDPPNLVVLVGPGDLELQHVGRRVGGGHLPAGLQCGS